MHQNLAVILWQFNFGKNSFIVLIPVSLIKNDDVSFIKLNKTVGNIQRDGKL